jgi:hypothetical protein
LALVRQSKQILILLGQAEKQKITFGIQSTNCNEKQHLMQAEQLSDAALNVIRNYKINKTT